MLPTTEAQKRAMAKWREKNQVKFNASRKASSKLWRQNHKEDYLKRNGVYVDNYAAKWKNYLAETRRLRKILFDG
jgi:hypothetical protein